jgi:wyosine [tRNA(Phe)-imidazoG37] synthetase (radical SAM superfamily)
MLVGGLNDAPATLAVTADVIAELCPAVAYLGVPTRPPAGSWVRAPDETTLNRAYHIFAAVLPRVELLIGYEGNAFAASGDAVAGLLSITAVHPLRNDAATVLEQRGISWKALSRMALWSLHSIINTHFISEATHEDAVPLRFTFDLMSAEQFACVAGGC